MNKQPTESANHDCPESGCPNATVTLDLRELNRALRDLTKRLDRIDQRIAAATSKVRR